MHHRNFTYIQAFSVYSLSAPPYNNVHVNVSGLHPGIRISVLHVSTVPIVAVVKEQRTKTDQPDFPNRQTPCSNYQKIAGGLSAVNAFDTQMCYLISL